MAWAGHDEVTVIAQWAAEVQGWVLRALGAKPDPLTGRVTPPSESTLRRVLAYVDADQLQRLTARWLAATMTGGGHDDGPVGDEPGDDPGGDPGGGHDEGGGGPGLADGELEAAGEAGGGRLFGMAFDGKSVRGAAAGGKPRPHLLAAATHDGSIVLAQRQIPDKGSEITELTTLAAELDLRGKIATMDALHTQRATADYLVGTSGAEYIMTIIILSFLACVPDVRHGLVTRCGLRGGGGYLRLAQYVDHVGGASARATRCNIGLTGAVVDRPGS